MATAAAVCIDMTGHRIQRVNEGIKRELAQMVVGEVKDPRVGGVAITRVSAAPDLTLARVFVQLTGDEEARKETLAGLRAATPFMRTLLGQRLRMRRVPELRFEQDRNLEHAIRIEQLLHEAGVKAEPDGPTAPDEEPRPEPGPEPGRGREQDPDDAG